MNKKYTLLAILAIGVIVFFKYQPIEKIIAFYNARFVPSYETIYFNDIAVTTGTDLSGETKIIDQIVTKGHTVTHSIQTGAAWGDFNKDGCIDLFVSSPSGPNKLFKNNCDKGFDEVAKNAGIVYEGNSMGASWGDINNDGCLELFVTNHAEKNILYKNNCDETFTNITDDAGVSGDDNVVSTSVAWADYNNDGFLDIYVTNKLDASKMQPFVELFYNDGEEKYVDLNKKIPPATRFINDMIVHSKENYLYKNNGDETFTESAKEAGIQGSEKALSYISTFMAGELVESGVSYASGWFDYDRDGCIDVWIASDIGTSPLHHNNCDGTFSEVTSAMGVDQLYYGMGIAATDINRDGFLDVYISNAPTDKLYENNSGISFKDVAIARGIKEEPEITPAVGMMLLPDVNGHIGWGVKFFDYENDGDDDLYVANGGFFLDEGLGSQNLFYLFQDGNFFMTKPQAPPGLARSIGVATADFDSDGDVDIYVTNSNGPNNFYENTKDNENHWITLRLQGTESNYLGIGAEVEIIAGDERWVDQVKGGMSYLSQSDYALHFGLGNHDILDTVRISWPSGLIQEEANFPVDQEILIIEGQETNPI
jgi:enediyne biosynthesis protein E4